VKRLIDESVTNKPKFRRIKVKDLNEKFSMGRSEDFYSFNGQRNLIELKEKNRQIDQAYHLVFLKRIQMS
jgi:hypothetical protein